MEKVNKKEIKFEILRIISMVMIIVTHYSGHGGLANIETMSINKLIGIFLTISGNVGVNLFVFISGFFLYKSKFKVKKLIKLELEILFYSVSFYIINLIINMNKLNNMDLLKITINSVFPVFRGLYWFPTIYIGLYLLSPFINKLIKRMERKNYKALLIILFIGISLIPTSMFSGRIMLFIYLYLIAAYISKYDISIFKNKNWKNIIMAIVPYVLTFIIKVASIYIDNENISQFISEYIMAHASVFMLLTTFSIFMAVKNSKINGNNKLVFTLGETSFAVYLVHDNLYFREILWNGIFHTSEFFYANIFILIIHIILCVIIIYAFGTFIELFRKKCIEKPIFKTTKFDRFFNEIDNFIN